MIYSISNTSNKNRIPNVNSMIQNYGKYGKPFLVQMDIAPTEWYLINIKGDYGMPLDISDIDSSGDQHYYNGNVDLISYLEGLDYIVPSGLYKFKIIAGGIEKYMDLFWLDNDFEVPQGLGEYSDDYDESYAI